MSQTNDTTSAAKPLATAVAKLASADVLTVVAGVVLVVVLAKVGGAEALGAYASVMGWFTVLDMLADTGTETHVARSKSEHVRTALFSAIRTRFRTSIVAAILMICTPLVVPVPTHLCWLAALWLPLRALSMLTLAELRVCNEFSRVSTIQATIGAVQFFGGALAFYVSGLTAVFAWFTMAEVLRLTLSTRAASLSMADVKAIQTAEPLALRSLLTLAGIGIQSTMLSRIGVLSLSLFAPLAVTGVYSAAHRVISVARIVPGAVYRVLVSRLQAHAHVKAIHVSGIALGIGVVGSICIALLSSVIVEPLYSESIARAGAVEALQILSVLFTTQMIIHAAESFFISSHNEQAVNRILAAELLFVIIGLAVLAPVLTVQIVAWLVVLADVFAALWMFLRVVRLKDSK